MATDQRDTTAPAHDWHEAGEAWGSHANDWACLYEHYAVDVIMAMFTRTGVGPHTRFLDIACGSGLAVRLAEGTGASVAGIDASSELIAIARDRTPAADLRIGSMFELPWPDESFDAAIAVNGIWGGCEAALDEAFRVLRPGGLLGISFWGQGPPRDIRNFFKVLAVNAPDRHRSSMRSLDAIYAPGVAETMLRGSGFEVLERGARVSVVEFPDAELAWRGISSFGPAAPALRTNDPAVLRRQVLDALESCRDDRGIYRTRSDQHFVIARKP